MSSQQTLSDVAAPLNEQLAKMRAAFRAEGTVAYETRIERMDRCIELLVDNQKIICDAINQDFGCRSKHVTTLNDVYSSVKTMQFNKKHLKKWMKPEKRRAPSPMNLAGAKSLIYYQPKGVVGIMTPWNFPVNMIFSPLADILGAGNRCMIKPSEFTPAFAEAIQGLFARYFKPEEITVVTGGPEVGAAFAGLPLDHIIFTGATGIGKLVMKAASENLVPVTLELGGKSPTFVSESADIEQAAEKIILGKTMNAGQICVSPDYCFVPAGKLDAFIAACKGIVARHFPRIVDNPDFVAVINQRHFERLNSYLDDARAKGARIEEINPAGESWSDPAIHKMPVHLIIEPRDDMLCMQNEIFGPILNIKPYSSFQSCVDYVNAQPRPLAMYYFGKDKQELQRLIDDTIAGGMTVNDIGMHVGCNDIPFGGIGPSGMGSYHGYEGFRTFSHAKSVFKQGFIDFGKLGGTLPPYGERFEKVMAGQIKK